jgi:hypothetical protein
MKSIIFWHMTPCSPLSWNRRFGGTCLPAGSSWYYSSTLKIEAIGSFETSGATQWTTWRHIPEDDTLHNHHCENLKSYIRLIILFYSGTSTALTSVRCGRAGTRCVCVERYLPCLLLIICLVFCWPFLNPRKQSLHSSRRDRGEVVVSSAPI